MSEILAIGDLHIEKNKYVSDPIKPVLTVLRKAVEYCRINGLTDIILVGDIFNTPFPQYENIIRLIEFLLRKENQFITWHIIPGNHDIIEINKHSLLIPEFFTSIGGIDNVNIYSKPTLKRIDGIQYEFLPFPHVKSVHNTKEPGIKVAHFAAIGSVRDNGFKVKKTDKDSKKIKDKINFWLLGHIHKLQEGSNYLQTCSPLQHSFGEELPKGLIHLSIVKKKNRIKVKHKLIEIDLPYELYNVKLTSIDDIKKFEKEKRSNCFYKIFVHKNFSIPDDFLSKHKEIVATVGYNSEKQRKQLEKEILDVDEDVQDIDPKYMLGPFLRKNGLNRVQTRIGKGIVDNIISRIGQ